MLFGEVGLLNKQLLHFTVSRGNGKPALYGFVGAAWAFLKRNKQGHAKSCNDSDLQRQLKDKRGSKCEVPLKWNSILNQTDRFTKI